MPGHGVLTHPPALMVTTQCWPVERTRFETRKFTRLLLCYGQKLLSSH